MPKPISVTPDFAHWLLALRTRRALTQTALAERIGVSSRTLRSWEAGRTRPFSRSLHLVAAATDVPLDALLALEPDCASFESMRHDRHLERDERLAVALDRSKEV